MRKAIYIGVQEIEICVIEHYVDFGEMPQARHSFKRGNKSYTIIEMLGYALACCKVYQSQLPRRRRKRAHLENKRHNAVGCILTCDALDAINAAELDAQFQDYLADSQEHKEILQ